ncbi:MAG: hypothetical protein OEO19_18905 [Gammaproteobacteria bacterium]|nr:hypothetical protein [Gammaproteobacteria bacterium]MDH3448605.1 hypothetical protein [Gammaproteobacteria bacterium]
MDWVKIGSAVLMAAMLIYLFPRAKQTIENSPKGSASDWMGFIVPMAAIVLFIILLIALV